jgi:hypothetical protein
VRRFLIYLTIAAAPLSAQDKLAPTPPAYDLATYSFTAESTAQLHKQGKWLRDAQGRYVLLRGVNFGARNKLAPYIPIMPLSTATLDRVNFDAELAAVQPQLDLLHTMGVNVVRLPVIWKALEPTPNPNLDELMPEAKLYLQFVKLVIAKLNAEGIYVLIDFHQDIVSDVYGGDGFPDWALQSQTLNPQSSAPVSDKMWGTNYFSEPWYVRAVTHGAKFNRQVRATLRAFWLSTSNAPHTTNVQPAPLAQDPQTHLVKTIGQAARFLSAHDEGESALAILGYEPFNEPHQAGLNKREFEQKLLPAFYHRVEAELAQSDANAFVFIEPRMDWTVYDALGTEFRGLTFTTKPETFLPAPYTPAAPIGGVFSFHYYDSVSFTGLIGALDMQTKAKLWPPIFRHMSQTAEQSGLVPFLSEFGCSQDWTKHTNLHTKVYRNTVVRACMDLLYQQVESNLLNATYWNFDLYNNKESKDNWNGENFSLLGPNRTPRNVDIAARPYPMRSSAEPERVFFDLESKNAAIVLTGSVSAAPTVIYIPRELNYPGDDFEIRATSSAVMWDEKNQLLYWHPDPSLAQNQIIISAAGHFDSSLLPAESRTLLPAAHFTMVAGKSKPTPIAIPQPK